jgi:hypothetical protein
VVLAIYAATDHKVKAGYPSWHLNPISRLSSDFSHIRSSVSFEHAKHSYIFFAHAGVSQGETLLMAYMLYRFLNLGGFSSTAHLFIIHDISSQGFSDFNNHTNHLVILAIRISHKLSMMLTHLWTTI